MQNKYYLYENSVQSVEHDIVWVEETFRHIAGREPRILREDFCGTFRFATQWVKRDSRNRSIAVDLDSEPLTYGRRVHLSKLEPSQRRNLRILQQDVRRVTKTKCDIVLAFNFSFNVFKSRADLLQYFKSVRASLKAGGIFVLEVAGGPGMIQPAREQTTVKKNGKALYKYVWHQRSFDPISHDAKYSIHFSFPNGKKLVDAFTYDWRLWTLPELRDTMLDAGFSATEVYWESETSDGTEYVEKKKAPNQWAWVSYLVARR